VATSSPLPGASSQRIERVRLDLLPARMTREDDPPAWPRSAVRGAARPA
jgi:hypothetical protein